MVCLGYKAQAVDERMLDPKYVFEDISGVHGNGESADATSQISSLKKLIETKKKKATGYEESDLQKNVFFNRADISDFFKSVDPYEFLTKFNKVSTSERVLLWQQTQRKTSRWLEQRAEQPGCSELP